MSRSVLKFFVFLITFIVFFEGFGSMKLQQIGELRRTKSEGSLNVKNVKPSKIDVFENDFIILPGNNSTQISANDELFYQNKDLIKKNQKKNDKIVQFKKTIEENLMEYTQNINTKNEENDLLRAKLITFDNQNNAIKNLAEEKNLLTKELEALQTKYDSFLCEVEDVINQNNKLTTAYQELSDEKTKIENENTDIAHELHVQINTITEQKDNFENEIINLKKQIVKINLDLECKAREVGEARNESINYKEKVGSLLDQLGEAQLQLKKNIEFNKTTNDDIEVIQESDIKFDKTINELNEKVNGLNGKINNLEHQKEVLISQIAVNNNTISGLSENLKTLGTENNRLKGENDNQAKEYFKLSKTFSENQRYCKEKNEEITNLKEDIRISNEQIKHFEQENKELQQKIRSLELQIKQLQNNQNNNGDDYPEKNNQEITALQNTIKNLEALLDKKEEKHRLSMEKAAKECAILKQSEEALTKKIKSLESTKTILYKEEKIIEKYVTPTWIKFLIGGLSLVAALLLYEKIHKKIKEYRASKAA